MTQESLAGRNLLTLLREKYEDEGFTFIEYPSAEFLPAALERLRPDAIAIKADEKCVIVVRSRGRSGADLMNIQTLVKQADGWKLRVIDPSEVRAESDVNRLKEVDLAERRAELASIRAAGHLEAAMLFAWSILEAAMAARLGSKAEGPAGRALSTSSLIARLETLGEVEPGDAKQLRSMAALRNAIAHGDYERRPTQADLDWIESIIERLSPLDHAA